MKVLQISVGSWFQRTTLHLSEVYDFLHGHDTPLDLERERLDALREELGIEQLENVQAELEFISVRARNGVSFKIFEDGLIVLNQKPTDDTKADILNLTDYYETKLSPAIKYLFSLGAPIPKELANIKNVYPYFVILEDAQERDIEHLLATFRQQKHYEIKEKTFEIHRGDKLYIINTRGESLGAIEEFIQERIFIREFKAQLHRYLNLHRTIWENIAEVKERGTIRGKDIGEFKKKIERYDKTINLIGTRIEQMNTYVGTRGAIIRNTPELQKFASILQYKHETLQNTLGYVQEIWVMTQNYVASALSIFSDLQAKATNNSIRNLTVVTSMGVGGTLIGLFSETELPSLTLTGLYYFIILAAIGWTVNKVMKTIYLNKDYTIKNIEADKHID